MINKPNNAPISEDPEGGEDEMNNDKTTTTTGVTIPEDFQKQVHVLVHKATRHHLDHIRNRVSDREDELRKEEMAGKGDKKNASSAMPETLSASDMPMS